MGYTLIMRYFGVKQVREAVRWAAAGGQALHTHPFIIGKAPAPFVRAGERGELIAHLFDWNTGRLTQTARAFGVRRVYVHYAGTARQHVDLCARPLRAAASCCESPDDGARAWNVSQAKLWYARQNYTPARMEIESLAEPWTGQVGPNGKIGFAWLKKSVAGTPFFSRLREEEISYAVLPDELFGFVRDAAGSECERTGGKDIRFYAAEKHAGFAPAADVAIIFRLKIQAVAGLKAAFTEMSVNDIFRYGGEWAESGAEARYAAMSPDLFTERFLSVFHNEPARHDIRLAFGKIEGSAA